MQTTLVQFLTKIISILGLSLLLSACNLIDAQETIEVDTFDWDNPALVLANNRGTELICKGESLNLLQHIQQFSDSITALNLRYSQAKANDCSGTFIKLNQYLNRFCSEATLPSFKTPLRSTRDLVKYYHDIGQLIFIQDPLSSDSLIQPGTVMFYTKGGLGGQKEITAKNMQALVNHVGVVYEVERDESGQVVSYRLFHGRNPKRGINITKHQREPYGKSLKSYPYGNGNEQWMAAAPIVNNSKS